MKEEILISPQSDDEIKQTDYDRMRYHFPMQICINEQRVEQIKETVFLGVVLVY